MVMVIAFLTLTNIALGYGLAVYVNQKFGTLVFALPKKRKAKPHSSAELSEADAEVAPVSTQPISRPAATPEQQASAAAPPSLAAESSVSPVTAIAASADISASEPVDEQNVLAGIEEFRSQLAKMSVSAESPATEPERDLAGAAN